MHIVIVGNGITGTTAGRFIRRRSQHRVTIISDESDYFYARTALMYIYMGDLRFEDTKPYADAFWAKNRIDLVRGRVVRYEADSGSVLLASGERIKCDRVLLATGSRPNRFGWRNEHAEGVQGLYSLGDLRRMEQATVGVTKAVVVGGGLIGVEMAEMMASRGIEVTFLVREQRYMDYLFSPAESGLVEEAIRAHAINLELGAELEGVNVDPAGSAIGVQLTDGTTRPAGFVGLAVGVHPNIDLAKDSGVETGRGILVDHSFETSVPGVFAAGDCAEFREPVEGRKAIEQLWYTGRSHGRQVASCLLGETRPYRPPLFFNSAKFFDLEYQTYGQIGPEPLEGEREVVWGDAGCMLRIMVNAKSGAVVGVNGLGIRLRQAVWSNWIRSGASLNEVTANLKEGLFDPEFTKAPATTNEAA